MIHCNVCCTRLLGQYPLDEHLLPLDSNPRGNYLKCSQKPTTADLCLVFGAGWQKALQDQTTMYCRACGPSNVDSCAVG